MGKLVRGFTLLELLVALAIMGLGIALIYRAAGGNIRAAAHVGSQQRAVWLADALLAEHAQLPQGPLHRSGQQGELDWVVDSPSTPVLDGAAGQPALRGLRIAVTWPTTAERGLLELRAVVPQLPSVTSP